LHAGAFADRDVVVGADDLLPGDDGRRTGVVLDGRIQYRRLAPTDRSLLSWTSVAAPAATGQP
jgi:hypothetical protein